MQGINSVEHPLPDMIV
ncbi:hypothetical protein BUE80_DR008383 [Diplocarpon rosae]|nr:hypothetical protein BUE80_DR008383 [Diplocarpon rosae]